MRSEATSPKQYLESLPENRKWIMTELRNVLLKNLPEGFEEVMSYGMIGYVVPHSIYPKGYHVDPKQALPFINLASQKNFIALYHMGLYADAVLLKWFSDEYKKVSKTKLDMGKSCIRFKHAEKVPLNLIGELASKISVINWISTYEKNSKR